MENTDLIKKELLVQLSQLNKELRLLELKIIETEKSLSRKRKILNSKLKHEIFQHSN